MSLDTSLKNLESLTQVQLVLPRMVYIHLAYNIDHTNRLTCNIPSYKKLDIKKCSAALAKLIGVLRM